MKKEEIVQCPTCGAPCKKQWHGLELVELTGDETLASKSYKHIQPQSANTRKIEGLFSKYTDRGGQPIREELYEQEIDTLWEKHRVKGGKYTAMTCYGFRAAIIELMKPK